MKICGFVHLESVSEPFGLRSVELDKRFEQKVCPIVSGSTEGLFGPLNIMLPPLGPTSQAGNSIHNASIHVFSRVFTVAVTFGVLSPYRCPIWTLESRHPTTRLY